MPPVPHLLQLKELCDKCGIPAVYLQFFLYLFVGGSCSVCDVGGFYLLHVLGIPLLIASATSFTIATVINYFLSFFFVFERGRFTMRQEFVRVFAVSLVGLGLNTLIVYFFVSLFSINAVIAKTLAIPIVLFWNFMGRRLLVFHKTLPNAS